MTDMTKIGQRPDGVGLDIPRNADLMTMAPPEKPLAPVIDPNSLNVSSRTTDVFAMVERLKISTRHQKETTQQTLMSAAISSVLNRIAATNEEQAQLLRDLGDLTDKYNALAEKIALAVEACLKNDPNVKTLELKVKELEEAVERMRKTPEQHKKEIEAKERELDQAKKDLAEAKVAALAKDTNYQNLLRERDDVQKKIDATKAKLDTRSVFILSQALREAFLMPSDPEVGEDKRVQIADNMQFFLDLLGGEKLQEMVANGKMAYNFV